ncbi:replication factor C subunit 3-like [Vitis riparia]|uniref:replication factor C subunit 3-like n=1 Tax=Vitis riparia TaxID=96939 RepID=UPI00155A9DC6|nr:replication factor C subunit 3-like [Vitis riparia]XP_034676560.1 replication factor C subunit 3-like [Vitis riparia]
MPKLDPYPTSPWNSESQYGGNNHCHSPSNATPSTCWGKTVGPFRNRKSYDISTQESIHQLTQKAEATYYDERSDSYYRGILELESVINLRRKSTGCSSPGRDSHYTATIATSGATSLFLRIWGHSCFHSRESLFPSSIGQKPLRRRESAEPSLTNEKKKLDVDLMKDHTSANEKSLKEKAPAVVEQIPTMMIFKEKVGQKFKWADKYQPRTLTDFICHRDKAHMLRCLVRSGQSDHFIFEGSPGVGKRTMARALLGEVFGTHRLETTEALKDFNLEEGPSSSIQINVKISAHHIEVNLSELQELDAAHVVMELIKESSAIALNQKQSQCDNTSSNRAIILCGAEKLSEGDQLLIRDHLQTYRGHFKVYFCYSGTSMLQHLKSLCTVIQIPTPSKEEIVEVLEFIAKHEAIELPPRLAENMAEKAKHSVRQAIRSFEATWKLK